MKERIIYSAAFVGAFIVVSLFFVYASANYRNIFAFDFTPVENTSASIMSNGVAQAVIRKEELIKLKSELLDSIKSRGNYDTIRVSTADSSVIDSLRLLMKEIQKLKEGQAKPEQMAQPAQNIALAKSSAADSAYKNWIKNSVKLYEAMETKKAAKILQTYSDNIAREIIFKMKKRKAAEIIAEIKPDIASRIMSVQ